ncbi:MAG: hypothetical protein IJ522_00505 [Acidaminococcaceae bacterium]|nr:hypothetical protein [Acidaminococcaceae bacterium]
MRNFYHFDKSVFGKIMILLAFSFFAFGCHTGMEPVLAPQTTVKKEEASRISKESIQNNTETNTNLKSVNKQKRPETSLQRDASGFLLSENKSAKNPIPFPNHTKKTSTAQRHTQRDPFALPMILQEQKRDIQELPSLTPEQQTVSSPLDNKRRKTVPVQNQPAIPINPQEPCITGIFDNGKEKYVLLRWHQIQGVFRCGEKLGNGYYVKEITRSSVVLCPQQNPCDTKSITLPLH